jgi:hypothetical protein
MTSTPVIFLLKRSGIASDRPSGTILQAGEPAVCFGASDPGVYIEDSAGSIRKIGPSHYGTTAPNATPAGIAGNSIGELWTDSTTSSYYLKVWTGSAWQKIGGGFADSSNTANSATTAGSANSCIQASGAILSSGVVKSSDIGISGLPDPTLYGSGALFYQIQSSGAFSAGLYINISQDWTLT